MQNLRKTVGVCRFLGSSWVVLGVSWSRLGPSWGASWSILGGLGAVLGHRVREDGDDRSSMMHDKGSRAKMRENLRKNNRFLKILDGTSTELGQRPRRDFSLVEPFWKVSGWI